MAACSWAFLIRSENAEAADALAAKCPAGTIRNEVPATLDAVPDLAAAAIEETTEQKLAEIFSRSALRCEIVPEWRQCAV
jgi:hypothetical protein